MRHTRIKELQKKIEEHKCLLEINPECVCLCWKEQIAELENRDINELEMLEAIMVDFKTAVYKDQAKKCLSPETTIIDLEAILRNHLLGDVK